MTCQLVQQKHPTCWALQKGSFETMALPLTHHVTLGKCLELTSFIVSMRASILPYAAPWNDLWASWIQGVFLCIRENQKNRKVMTN